MKAKYINLLQYLNEQNSWCSSSHLAEQFSLSKRTIKTYIATIQTTEPNLVISSNKGYRVDQSKLVSFFTTIQTSIPDTPAERQAYLLLKLTATKQPLSIFDLAEELYISDSTLLNDLKKLKKQCQKHSLEIKQTKDTLQLLGTEKAKRQLIHSVLLTELDSNFVDMTKLQESFTAFDLDYIKEIVAEIFSNYAFFTNDYALTNIIIHLAIAIDRMKSHFQFPVLETLNQPAIQPSVYKIAEKIAENISIHYNLDFPITEIQDLALLISANGSNVNYTQISAKELEQVVSSHCLQLVAKISEKIEELYFINTNEPDFLIRFTLHIKNLLFRIANGYSSRNPMTETLKKDCPLIYDCAVQVSHVIQKELAHTITEDEIAYIAFHLGYALELQKQRKTKISCTILVPHYYNMNVQILEKIQKHFTDDLEIHTILTSEKELDYVETELIISAVKLKHVVTTPYVVINPFFTLEDRQQVAAKIFEIKEKKRRNQFIHNFLSIVDEKRFFYSTESQSFESLLADLCSQMVTEGIVNKQFFTEVMEREQLSSTAFGAVAIPHSLSMNANQTRIYIVVNPTGIQWQKNKVTLVFLISINYQNRHIFREIFDDLATICTNEQNVHTLSHAVSFEQFIKSLISCFSNEQH